jgi:hypothetical protein
MAGRTTRAELLSPRPPDVRLHLADRYILATYWAMAARLLSLWPEIWTSKPIASLTCGTILVCDVTNFLIEKRQAGAHSSALHSSCTSRRKSRGNCPFAGIFGRSLNQRVAGSSPARPTTNLLILELIAATAIECRYFFESSPLK